MGQQLTPVDAGREVDGRGEVREGVVEVGTTIGDIDLRGGMRRVRQHLAHMLAATDAELLERHLQGRRARAAEAGADDLQGHLSLLMQPPGGLLEGEDDFAGLPSSRGSRR